MQLRHDEIRSKYGETHFLFVLFEWVNKWKCGMSKMLVFIKAVFTCTVDETVELITAQNAG